MESNTLYTPENNGNKSNTSIADELIYGQSSIEETTEQKVETTPQEEQVNGRVDATKSKMYVLLFLGIGLLLLYKFVLPAYDSNKASKQILDNVQAEIASFQDKKQEAENNLALLQLMENKEDDILSCINAMSDEESSFNSNKCAEFTGKNLDEVKDFLNLNNLSNNKMVIDEKKILANLNEFLLRKNNDGEYNGTIEWVHIWEEESFDKNIFISPVDLKIAFDNKDDLLSFVDNIEKRILQQRDYRILYQIENIKYDILKSQEKQSVDIAMNMFYTR